MAKKIRFGKYLKEAAAHNETISYNDLIPQTRYDEQGRELNAQAGEIKLRSIDVHRLLQPYVTSRALEQAKSALPVVLVIAFLLGIGVAFAEPAIGALKAAAQVVKVENAPYLYALLNDW